ncbi:carbon starvation induced protein CsiD [Rhizobium leguminosarum]|uniref:carbon starvation induced protein CsiD n=1 Tax=Rhizobium leguminosarum TaxID=384 RepID=UPI003D1538CF
MSQLKAGGSGGLLISDASLPLPVTGASVRLVTSFTCGNRSSASNIYDWAERDQFRNRELGHHPFTYKAPGLESTVNRPTFFENEYGPAISFIDQFAQPQTGEEAKYLYDLSASMETSTSTKEIRLPVSDLVVLNNYFWLHDRAAFQKHPTCTGS